MTTPQQDVMEDLPTEKRDTKNIVYTVIFFGILIALFLALGLNHSF